MNGGMISDWWMLSRAERSKMKRLTREAECRSMATAPVWMCTYGSIDRVMSRTGPTSQPFRWTHPNPKTHHYCIAFAIQRNVGEYKFISDWVPTPQRTNTPVIYNNIYYFLSIKIIFLQNNYLGHNYFFFKKKWQSNYKNRN